MAGNCVRQIYLAGDVGNVVLAKGTGPKWGWRGPRTLSASPTGARAQLGITYPGKEAWEGRELADPASRATVVIGF